MCKALVLKTLKREGKDFLRLGVKLLSFSGIDTDFGDDLAKGDSYLHTGPELCSNYALVTHSKFVDKKNL